MPQRLLFYLKVSRPGLWFATVWLYLLPTSQNEMLLSSFDFWYGFFYVCFPLNFLVYGWNDSVDFETDKLNPRKDSFWFGAKGSKEELQNLWKPMLIVQVIFMPYLIYLGSYSMVFIILLFLLINGLYNLKENGIRSKPPFELLCQIGYLLVVPLSMLVNDTGMIPWQTFVYLFLFSMQSHLIGEVMDIEPDRKSGRKTTATILGMQKTKLLIIGIVCMEVGFLFYVFRDFIFGSVLAMGLVWLLLDLLVIYKTKRYTVGQMKFFAFGSNMIAVATIGYVWYTGCLMQVG